MDRLLNIIHEDADLLVVNKPAGLVCHPSKGDSRSSLIGRFRLHAGEGIKLHMVNRLDRETSGVVVCVKGDRVAKEIRGLFERRRVGKSYQAIVQDWPEQDEGVIDAPIGRDEESVVGIKRAVLPGGAAARTAYTVVNRFEREGKRFALLNVEPHTGRTHQIRVHLAHIGHPLVGEKIYGADETVFLDFVNRRLTAGQREQLLLPCHALHACRLSFAWRGETWEFVAESEEWFSGFVAGEALPREWAERYV